MRLFILTLLLVFSWAGTFAQSTLQPAGHALNFGTANDYVSIDNLKDYNFSTNDWTISFWVKPQTGGPGVQGLVTKRNNSGDGPLPTYYNEWSLLYNTTTGFLNFTSKSTTFSSSYAVLHNDVWTHIALKKSGSTIYFYYDGVSKDTLTLSTSIIHRSTVPVYIGSAPVSGTSYGSGSFSGSMDEVLFWDTALPDAAIAQTMNRTLNSTYVNTNVTGVNWTNILAYYRFDQGTASGSNAAVDSLASELDLIAGTNTYNGTLNAFTLNGNTGNWINSSAPLGVTTNDGLTFPSYNSVIIEGTETGDWLPGDPIIQRGVVYSTLNHFDPYFTSTSEMTYVASSDLLSQSNFSTQIDNLVQGRVYAYKTYILTNSGHYAYGQEKILATGLEPTGNALSFDGTNDSLGVFLEKAQNTSEWSIDFWLKPDVSISGTDNVILYRYFKFESTFFYTLRLNYDATNDEFDYDYYNGTLNGSGSIGAGLTLDVWNHVAFVYDGSDVVYYLNGIAQGNVVTGVSPKTYKLEQLLIGAEYNNGSDIIENGFKGELDELRLWDADISSDLNNVRFCETNKARLDTAGFGVGYSNLFLYYNFNQGLAEGNNSGTGSNPKIEFLIDQSQNGYNAKLARFALGNSAYGDYVSNAVSNFGESGLYDLRTLETVLDISLTAATLTGYIEGPWFDNGLSSRGVVVSEIDNFDPRNSAPADTMMFYASDLLNDTFNVQVNGLEVNTRYFYRVFSVSSEGVLTFANQEELITSIDPPGYALDFDGNDDRVRTPITKGDLGNDYTITLWMKYEGDPTGNYYSPIIGAYEAAGNSDFAIERDYGDAFFQVRDGSNRNGWGVGTTAFDGNWHHLVFRMDNGVGYLYIDGELLAFDDFGGAAAAEEIYIGWDQRRNIAFNGKIDEVRIWNVALDMDDVREMMVRTIDNDYITTNLSGVSTASLLGYYRFDTGLPNGDNTSISVIQDFSSSGNTGTMSNFALTGTNSNFVNSEAALGVKTVNQTMPVLGTSADLQGVFTGIWTVYDPAAGGFCYSTTKSFNYHTQTKVAATFTNDTLRATINSLVLGETYYYRAFGVIGSDTVWGNENSFLVQSDVPGNAIWLDGNNDVIVSSDNIDISSQSFTLETWARKELPNSRGYMFGQGRQGTNEALHVGFADANSLSMRFYGNDVNASDVIEDSLWHHYAFVYDAATKTRLFYLDGNLIYTYTNTSREHYLGTGEFYVGGGFMYNAGYNVDEFDGEMDEVRVWKALLDRSEIRQLMSRSIDQTWVDANLTNATWSDLQLYYRLDQGIPEGDNNQERRVFDFSGKGNDGYAVNMDYSGITSNYVASGANVGVLVSNLTVGETTASFTANTTGIWVTGASPNEVGFYYSTKYAFNASSATLVSASLIGTSFNGAVASLDSSETYYLKAFLRFGADTIWSAQHPFVTASNPPGNNLQFDGTNDYVTIPHDNTLEVTSDFTLEAWVKSNYENWTNWDPIIYKTNAYWFRTQRNSKNMYFYVYASGGWRGVQFAAPTGFDIRVWHHYAGVLENDTIRIFVDGVMYNETAMTQTVENNNLTSLEFGRGFDGHIDEVRIWDTDLSVSDILNIKNRTLTQSWVSSNMESATWSNLKAYYRFDQGIPGGNNKDENFIYDFSSYNNNGSLLNFALNGSTSNWVASSAYLGVKTHEIVAIGFTDATIRGSLTGTWYDNVDEVGLVYSATQGFDPSLANGVDVFEEVALPAEINGDEFTIDIAGLVSGKKYFFRAFARIDGRMVLGEEKFFATAINPPGNALAFDGVNDYVRVYNSESLSPENEITIELWTKNIGDTWSDYYSLVTKRDAYWLLPIRGQKRIYFRVYNTDLSYRQISFFIPQGIDLEDWHHYAFTYDGSTMKMYIDGKEMQSNNFGSTELINQSDYNLRIGRSTGNNYYEGKIDEVRIWHKALTADQLDYIKNRTLNEELVNDMIGLNWTDLGVNYRFDQGIPGAENPGEHYLYDFSGNGNRGILFNFDLVGTTSNWVKSDAALGVTTLTNFDFAAGQGTFRAVTTDLWEGNFSERGIAYSSTLNFSPSEGDPFTKISSVTPLSSDTFEATISGLSASQMIFYRGYATTDNVNFAYGESQAFVPGINPPGNALHFNGNGATNAEDDYVLVGHSGSVSPEEELTVELWAKSDNSNWSNYGMIHKYNEYRVLAQRNSNDIQFLVYTSDNSYRYVNYNAPASFDITQFHHYSCTYDGYEVRIYVDGFLKASQDYGTFMPIRDNRQDDLNIGRYDANNILEGTMDELRIWKKALTESQIQAMRNRTIDRDFVNGLGGSLSYDDLGMYMRFDQGIANGDNTGIPIVYDYTGNKNFGGFNGFTLNGNISNFVRSEAGIGVSTYIPTGVSFDQATLNGELTGIFYDNIIEKGFVFSDQEFNPYNPGAVVADTFKIAGNVPGEFDTIADNLGFLTKYFYNAYYKTDNGTYFYGNQVSFYTTLNPPGYALHFDRTDDRVNLYDLEINSTDTVTIEFWMNWEGRYNAVPLGFNNYGLRFIGGFFGFFTNSNDLWGMANADVLANRWVHVAAVFVRNDVEASKLYINGVEQVLERRYTPPTERDFGVDLRLGALDNGNWDDFEGTFDEFRIWNKGLSATQINEVFDRTIDKPVVDSIPGLNYDNLLVYFRFDQGNANANNVGLTSLRDLSNYGHDGELEYFLLDGDRSNIIVSNAHIGVKTVPTVTNQSLDEVKLYGEITGIWNTTFTDSGFVYATSEYFNPEVDGTYVKADLAESGSQFAKVVGSLPNSTKHYFRAYVVSEWDTPSGTVSDTVYGVEKEFLTSGVYPTTKYYNLEDDQIRLYYRLIGAPLSGGLSSGIKYSTTEGFDPNATGTSVLGAAFFNDTLSSLLTGLTEGETYFYRPYVTNGTTTLYGDEQFCVAGWNPPGNTLIFAGSDDHIVIGPANEVIPSSNFTLTTWVKYSYGNLGTIFKAPRFNSTAYALALYINRNSLNQTEAGKIGIQFLNESFDSEEVASVSTDFNDDKWHFVAVAMGENGVKLYVDGELEGESPYRLNTTGFGSDDAYIGMYNPNYWEYRGEMDEFRIWKKELDIFQLDQLAYRTIDEDYVNDSISGVNWEDLMVYYRFDQGTAGGTNTTEDVLFDYSSKAWHGAMNYFDLTGTAANFIESTAPLGVSTLDASAVYTLGEATLQGVITDLWYTAPVDTGFIYSTTQGFDPSLAGTSIEANVHVNDSLFKRTLVGLDPVQTYYFRAYATAANGRTAYGIEKPFIPGGVNTLDTIGFYDGSQAELYGIVTGDFTGIAGDTGIWFAPVPNFNPASYPSNYVLFDGGNIDTFMVNLTGLNAGTTYYFRAFVDVTSGPFLGSRVFGEEFSFRTLSNPPGNALDLDGANDWVNMLNVGQGISDNAATGYTWEAWLNSGIEGGDRTLWSMADTLADNEWVWLYSTNHNGERHLRIRIDNSYYYTNYTIEDSLWHHVALTVDPINTKTKIYLDGALILDLDQVQTFSTSDIAAMGARLYDLRNADRFFDGAFDEVRVWDTPLTESQLNQMRFRTLDQTFVDSNVSGLSWSDLIAYYRMDQGVPEADNDAFYTLVDLSGNGIRSFVTDLALSGTTSNWIFSGAPLGVTTERADSYEDDGGDFYGAITGVWYSAPLDSGIVYSSTSGFAPALGTMVSSNVTSLSDTFKVEMRDIFTPGQFYYYRAYVQVSDSIWTYGDERSFYAGGILTLDTITNVTSIEATCFGEIVSNFPSAIDTGIVYYLNEGSDPDTVNASQFVSTLLKNVDTYWVTLDGLRPATRYYYRAYIDLGGSKVYGDEYSFITVSTPPGRAIDLDLDNDYIEINHDLALNPTTQMSYSLWAKSNFDLWTTSNGYGVMLSKGEAYLFRGNRNSKQIQVYFYFEGLGWRNLNYNPDEYFQIDEWHHYAVTFDGTTMAFYVDGDLKTSTTAYNGRTIRSNNTNVHIGHDSRYTAENQQNFRGQIDEVRIWDVGLTEAQVQQMMDRSINEDYVTNSVSGLNWSNLQLYYTMDDGAGGVDNTNLTNVNDDSGKERLGFYRNVNLTGNTSNYVNSGAAFGVVTDNTIYNPDLTTNVLNGHITGVWFTTPDQVGFQYSTARDFSVAPVKVYGSLRADSTFSTSITGLTLGETYYYRAITEVNGVTSYGFTKVLMSIEGNPNGFVSNGNALAFDGTNDYIHIDNASLDLANRSFTIESWTRKRYMDSRGYFFSHGTNSTNNGLYVGYADNNTLYFDFWGNNVGVDVIPDTLWHHMAFVYDATTYTKNFYFDGRLMRSYTNASRPHFQGSGDARIGARFDGYNDFEGELDEMRVWGIALGQSQINTLKTRTVDSLYLASSGLGLTWDDLQLYYRFDQGTGGTNNFGEYYIFDYANPRNDGALANFSMGGEESNWIKRSAPIGVETTEISNIGTTFAHIEGQATGTWNDSVIMRGVVYSELNDFDPENVSNSADTTHYWSTTDPVSNTFEVDLTGLSVGGQYSFVTMVVAENGDTAYSALSSFNTVMDPPGNALSLDGGNDYVSIIDTLDLASRSFTFEIWARKQTINEAGFFFWQGTTITNLGLHIGYRNSNVLTIDFWGNGVNVTVDPDTLWHQYTFVYDAVNKTRRIYMDGDNIYEYTNAAREHYLGTGETNIGRYVGGGYFNGDIDEVRIWHAALNDAQVAEMAFRTIDSTYINDEIAGLHWDSLYVNYRFDQGDPRQNNSGVTTVTDLSGNQHSGLLTNMLLSGDNSNWIDSEAGIGLKSVRTSNILASEITLYSQVTGKWYSEIVDSGIVYNTLENFMPLDTAIAFVSANQPVSVDTFITVLSGLEHSTNYYYRPYAVSVIGDTVFGLQQMFTTAGISTLDSVENVTGTSLTLFGRLNNPIPLSLDTGIVLSPVRDFVPNTGTFVSGSILPANSNTYGANITGLVPSTVYFFRAYIYNATDTLYGEQRIVRTLSNPAGNAIDFDGINDWIELPGNLMNSSGLSGSNEITIEFYFKGTDLQSAIRISEGTDNYITIGFNNPPMAVMSNNSGPSGGLSISNVIDVEDNEWHHVAMTWKRNAASGFRVYVDGVMSDDNSSTNIPLPSFTNNAKFSIGSKSGDGAYPFIDGTMDEIRIWNKALTQEQLLRVYERTINASFVDNEVAGLAWSNLVAYYRSDLGEAGLDNEFVYQFNDFTDNNYDGTLYDFNLNGLTSNFIESDAFSGLITTPDYYTIPSSSEADVYAFVTGVWYDAIIDSGAVFSLSQGFDPDTLPTSRFTTAFTTSADTFITRLSGLISGSEYYYRAYLITASGDTAYGDEASLIAGGVETLPQSDRLGASILTFGRTTGAFPTASDTGVVYSPVNGFDPSDYLGNFVSTLDGGLDTFSVQLNNLLVNTDYYYRAYVINGTDTILGSQQKYHTADNPAGNALNYDGVNDYVEVLTPIAASLNAAEEMTLETWFKPDDVNRLMTLLGFTSSNGSVNRIIVSVDANKHITAIINSSNYPVIGGGVDVVDGEWHHLAVVSKKSPALTSVYIDGILVGTAAEWAGFNPTDILGVGVEFNYVAGKLPVARYQGNLDEIRIWDSALSEDLLYKFMNRTVSEEYLDTVAGISGDNLIAYFRADQGVAGGNNAGENQLFDFSGNEHHGSLINFGLNGATSNWVESGALTGVVTLTDYEPQLTSALAKGLKTGMWFNGYDSAGVVFGVLDGFDPTSAVSFKDDDNLLNNDTIESTITGLAAGGVFYYRAFVAKDGYVKYGAQQLLQTGGVYTLNKYETIGGDSITLFGSIVGNVSPSNYGFIYSTNSDLSAPTTVTTNTINNDTFSITINGLIPGETYYFGALVNTTLATTIYGDTLKFATLSNPSGNALDFDGSDSYIRVDNDVLTPLAAASNGITVETWFNTTQTVSQQAIFGFHNSNGAINRFVIDITNDDRLALYVNNVQYIIGSDVTDENWHHIAVVSEKSPAETRVYLDGALVYTLNEWAGLLSADQLVLGGELDNSIIDEVLYGKLDEFRLWDVPLTTSQLNEVSIAALDKVYVDAISGLSWGDLVAYYNFDFSDESGDNSMWLPYLYDVTGNGYNGTFNGFDLTGTDGNFVLSDLNIGVKPISVTSSGTNSVSAVAEVIGAWFDKSNIQRGMVYSQIQNFDPSVPAQVEGTQTNAVDGYGQFTTAINGLMDGTKYYFRPYAEYNGQRVYGTVDSIETDNTSLYYVDIDAVGDNNGTSWTHAFSSLTDALEIAGASDTIFIAEGTYYPEKDLTGNATPADNRAKTFTVRPGVYMVGGFDGTEVDIASRNATGLTILSGDIGVATDSTDNSYHVLSVSGFAVDTLKLNSLTIQDGNADGLLLNGYGGGLFAPGYHIVIESSTLLNNSATYGGAIYFDATNRGWLNMVNTTIYNNTATQDGSAMYLFGLPVQMEFDGINDHIQAPNSVNGRRYYTWYARVRTLDTQTHASKDDSPAIISAESGDVSFFVDNGYLGYYDTFGSVTSVVTSKFIADGFDHDVVMVRENGVVRIYVDGVQVDADINTGTTTFSSANLLFGTNVNHYAGNIYEIKIFSRNLSAAEVANIGTVTTNVEAHYINTGNTGGASGTWADQSVNSYHGIVFGTPDNIGSSDTTVLVVNTTIAGNTYGDEASIYSDGSIVSVSNSILWNQGNELFGADIDVSNSIVRGGTGNAAYDLANAVWPFDPMLDPLGLKDNGGFVNTINLFYGPAVDNGSLYNAPLADANNNARTATPDLGAVEYGTATTGNSFDMGPANVYLTSSGFTAFNVRTIDFWIKPAAVMQGGYLKLNGTVSVSVNASNQISISGVTASAIYIDGVATNLLVADVWQHVSIVSSTNVNVSELQIANVSSEVGGHIDELRLWDVPLTLSQLNALRFVELTNDGTNLVDPINRTTLLSGQLNWSNIKSYYRFYDNNFNDIAGGINCSAQNGASIEAIIPFEHWLATAQTSDWNDNRNWFFGLIPQDVNTGYVVLNNSTNNTVVNLAGNAASVTAVYGLLINQNASFQVANGTLNIKGKVLKTPANVRVKLPKGKLLRVYSTLSVWE